MRTISKKEADELQVRGGKVTKLTEAPKPPPPMPEIPDHSPQLADLERRTDANRARGEEIAHHTAGELTQQRQLIEHLAGELHGLKHELSSRAAPPRMEVRRNQFTGFIDTVSVGRLTFRFDRNRVGSVETISIITTK